MIRGIQNGQDLVLQNQAEVDWLLDQSIRYKKGALQLRGW